MSQLVYLYAERHPLELRKFIKDEISKRFIKFSEVSYESTSYEIRNKLSRAEFVLMAPGRFLPDEIHESAKRVKLYQLWSSGYDKINQEVIRKLGHMVSTNGGANKFSVAEHTLLLMLATARRLPEMHERVTKGQWEGNGHGMNLHTLQDKTVGIIGLGAIGSEVARLCLAFRMKVIYFDPKKNVFPNEGLLRMNSIEELLRNSDFVTLHTHYTPGAKPILTQKLLSEVKKNAVIINTSREELIDIKSLIEELKNENISFYGADVFEKEPTTGHEELMQEKNVVLTPHIAGSNLETYKLAISNCLDNIERVNRGEAPMWRVV